EIVIWSACGHHYARYTIDSHFAGISNRSESIIEGLAGACAGGIVFRSASLAERLSLSTFARNARSQLRRLCIHRIFPERWRPVDAGPESRKTEADFSNLDSSC